MYFFLNLSGCRAVYFHVSITPDLSTRAAPFKATISSAATATELCRLVVIGPERQIEAAVPANVLVADLLPALLHHLGDNLADAGLAHGGWVLQQFGGVALDEDRSIADLGLDDGETIYLRPRSDQIPPVHFDDLADGIAAGVRNRAGRWRPEMIRWVAMGALAAVLMVGAAVLSLSGPPSARALCALAVAVFAMAAAVGLTRSMGDSGFGAVGAVAGIGYAVLAAMVIPDLTGDNVALTFAAPQVFAGSVAALVFVVLIAVLLRWPGPRVAGLIVGTFLAAVGSGLAAFVPLSAGKAAALVAVVATVATVRVPLLAFRLARIDLPPLPSEPEHLQEDIDPEPSSRLLPQTVRADAYMTGLYAGLASVVAVSMVVVALVGGWASGGLVVVVALVRLLALRPMNSAWHRLAHAAPSVAGLAVVVVVTLADAMPLVRVVLPVVAAPLAGVVFVAIGRSLPRRRLMPYWGRIGDIVQLAATIGMLPLLLAVLGAYGAARALGG
ncbi:type VII secretion integral membrane protein EccD [Actinoplanes sp. TBRC 11911]|uniref:type VII secretion integral membrane protein EccD n=1 Tax=Actinoplanes sp. TBRC 11911 TaxID=2729386 RepID=UPI00145FA0AF|nr:type VII secretion integral membrane protein EccD [Actinoplanes sp. TBRC 11911]NMO55381.1 type VII secretion integral membrane protein EccD [Actinoplanes sp. TBRC 11911]